MILGNLKGAFTSYLIWSSESHEIHAVNNFLYSCDGSFHLDDVKNLLNVKEAYGFMIMDGK